jgi:hypothetical protein
MRISLHRRYRLHIPKPKNAKGFKIRNFLSSDTISQVENYTPDLYDGLQLKRKYTKNTVSNDL